LTFEDGYRMLASALSSFRHLSPKTPWQMGHDTLLVPVTAFSLAFLLSAS